MNEMHKYVLDSDWIKKTLGCVVHSAIYRLQFRLVIVSLTKPLVHPNMHLLKRSDFGVSFLVVQ